MAAKARRGRRMPSTIDRLEPELRDEIARLRNDGAFIDEILAHLRKLDVAVSRSALARHTRSLDAMVEKMRHSRTVADSLVRQFGEQPDNKLARANIELMHSVVMETLMASAAGAEDGSGSGAAPVTFDPEQVMFLARSLQSLASAEKTNSDRMEKAIAAAEKRATAAAAEKATVAARSRGLGKETVDAIRFAVLGSQG